MYGGRVVESGPVGEVFTRPRHRYTEGLLAASDLETAEARLNTIPGNVPSAGQFPSGCVFRTRCRYATDVCSTTPAWSGSEATGFACHHPAEVAHARA
jgi:oligopeptide/dipeptide ABC transporter ATP-binding protein